MIVLRLPIPPSVNGLYKNVGRSRAQSKRYRDWLVQADKWYYLQHLYKLTPITGKCEIEITLPKVRADIDNLCKAPIDWLVSRKLTDDDRNNKKITIKVDEEMQTRECWITVRAA